MTLFSGLDRAYGFYDLSQAGAQDARGKIKGAAKTRHEPVTELLWQRHLDGAAGLGVIPIRADSTCFFGALDVDAYLEFDIVAFAQEAEKHGLPIVPCRSKSGGVHAYIFTSEPVPAALMRSKLREIAVRLGRSGPGNDLFPGQDVLHSDKDNGNWINMPYFDVDRTTRYAVRSTDGGAMSAAEFLEFAEGRRQPFAFFETPLGKAAAKCNGYEMIPEGPPCLQELVMIGFPEGSRNNGLTDLAVFLRKAFPDDWRDKLNEYNGLFFDPPLPPDEVASVLGSVTRKPGYRYMCKKEPIKSRCDAKVCMTRRHGVGREEGQSPVFPTVGQLRKLDTNPPTWFMDIGGETVELTTEELLSSKLFQKRCVEVLNNAPPVVSQEDWRRIVNGALAEVQVMEAPADSSSEGFFWELLEKFCTGRGQAKTKGEMLLGRPYTEDGVTWFRMIDIAGFLERNHFREFKVNRITAILSEANAKKEHWKVRSRGFNVWGVPEFARPEIEKKEDPGDNVPF